MIQDLTIPGVDTTTPLHTVALADIVAARASTQTHLCPQCQRFHFGVGLTTHAATTHSSRVEAPHEDRTGATVATSAGLYGAIALALGLGILEPLIAILMAITPLLHAICRIEALAQHGTVR